MSFEVGKKFSSYEEIKSELQKYSAEYHSNFFLRDSRKLTSSAVKERLNIANKELIYYKLKLCCVFGGRDYQRNKNYKGERQSK